MVAAALTPRGVCGKLLQAVLDGRYVAVTCPLLLTELREVLVRPKFRRYLSEEEALRFVAAVASATELCPDPMVQSGVTPDPDDDYLVSLAQAAGADFLISGDPHLLALGAIQPPVLNPRDFLDRLG